MELLAIQSREFETNKKVAFAAVLSVFQDFGYIVSSADFETGFITAASPKRKTGFLSGLITNAKATAFIEEIKKGHTKVRLNFVNVQDKSLQNFSTVIEEEAVEDPAIYQNAFTKIQEAIFIRNASE